MRSRPALKFDKTTEWEINQRWNDEPPSKRNMMLAMENIYGGHELSLTRIAGIAGISRRQLGRWIERFNRDGIQGLLYPARGRPGRKRKINHENYQAKVKPLVERFHKEKTTWTVTEFQQQLAAEAGIRVSLSTLRRAMFYGSILAPAKRKAREERREKAQRWPEELYGPLSDFLAGRGPAIEPIVASDSGQSPHIHSDC